MFVTDCSLVWGGGGGAPPLLPKGHTVTSLSLYYSTHAFGGMEILSSYLQPHTHTHRYMYIYIYIHTYIYIYILVSGLTLSLLEGAAPYF